ncbi:SGNH/GDSL hydrolase family protein [Flexivirga sp. ID2601S]|uniref:SGNH/GDSL hydrolase family protein n=1 Tax=Flexivirga aerilata TaxID=1656889 RepID=A0A849AB60_9MICO|nr:SGNH/GDSL hydrolase family protein [Flexivirga aerilata]NNG38154.1 SGNH/GDSL hydrolase family protein [Flexivirga aerilata]
MKRIGAVLSATAGLAAAALVMPSADAAGTTYVALGDSYSAGVGTRSSQNSCYQSPLGYAPLIASAKGLALSYQACSGAKTADVSANQLGTLGTGTRYVTMTIGGNDVGFSSVLTECAKPGWMSDCNGAIAGGRAVLTGSLPGRYDSLFASVRSKAPNAKIVISGYPHIFNGEDCNALTFFSPDEEASLNSATDDLNSLERTKAGAHSMTWVDPRAPFTGHEVCGTKGEWINGLSNPVEESYHPNTSGNKALAAVISPSLVGSSMPMPSIASSGSTSRTLPGAVAVPNIDLASPESLRGAKRAGLNPAEIKALNTDLHSGDGARQKAAMKRLKQLDRQAAANLSRA